MELRVKEQEMRQSNPFGTAYIQDYDSISSFFHYSPYREESFKKRLDELNSRNYNREDLARVIRSFHSKWEISEKVEENISKLKLPNSVVVVGGQQAGLLLGPLYTLHKIITILQLAKQKEEALNTPVVPLFWIAGEDHDYLEVNHVYTPRAEGTLLDKLTLTDSEADKNLKKSLSHRLLPNQEVQDWVNQFFEQQPETEFTTELRKDLDEFLSNSSTFVDFFASIINHFFSRYGLLMIDSGDKEFRGLQSHVFIQIIENYELIDQEVRASIERVKEANFTPQVHVGDHPALLFIYENQERLLVEKVEDDLFQTKDGQYSYTTDQMIRIAREEPWLLSNNVITRPLMQESLFPTLAFVGGPGEIAYWALYKSYFEQFNMSMPILAPRISVTLIEKPIAKIIAKREIPLQDVVSRFDHFRSEWLKQQDDRKLEETFEQVKREIERIYAPLLEKVTTIPGIDQLGDKNLSKIIEQVDFLEKRSIAAFTSQHEATIRQLDKVEQALYPQQNLQERVFNPFTYINKHGMVLVEQLVNLPLSVNGKHKWIYIE
jgi:bacillithiol biosynthesis cysteine-adding enzyme BshC